MALSFRNERNHYTINWLCSSNLALTMRSFMIAYLLIALTLCFTCARSARYVRRTEVPNLISCPCSPSNRGFASLHQFVFTLRRYNIALIENDSRGAVHSMADKVRLQFASCVKKHGMEACVDMDAALRKILPVQLCIYDERTGRNLKPSSNYGPLEPAIPCSDSDEYRSKASNLGSTPMSGVAITPNILNNAPPPPLPPQSGSEDNDE